MPLIDVHYDRKVDDLWSSREKIQKAFRSFGGVKAKWNFSAHRPKNWLGYTAEDPSPGADLDWHVFEVEDPHDVTIMLLLGGKEHV